MWGDEVAAEINPSLGGFFFFFFCVLVFADRNLQDIFK